VDYRNRVGRIRRFSGVLHFDRQKECAARSVDADPKLPGLFGLEVGVATTKSGLASF
jgi:hypothetical protein